ncbi:hypothetical protein J2Z76_002598 [Sedimentibacter acidaminivorans]|uniref:Flp pilus-assembly TadG-like N-terminal domain-containing protein n=1 Tax=Sedimentibacter acidaminivorans TaxID=913099 RepID=A0ABS4GGA7_9FIRM|nr:hypothetical protein [Sedimentibacter acidaminivorans]MBP1926728.1 hypothetical protein [Sedimentibacter acidaminivorans]
MKKKRYLNNKGNSYIWLIIFVVIFLGVGMLVMDQGSIYLNNKKVKEGLNRSVKAATLAIKEDEMLAEGRFKIDEVNAQINFKNILAENLGLDKTTLEPLETGSLVDKKPDVKEFVVENNTPKTYYSTILNHSFELENPSVMAVVQVKVKGVFSSKIITMYKLSSSQLTSIYE